MTQWTPEAERQLGEYLARVGALSRANGDDADEIVEGLEQHIRAEAEGKSSTLVTTDHVGLAIAALGTPEQVVEGAGAPAPERNGNGRSQIASGAPNAAPVAFYGRRARGFVVYCGLVIPSLSLAFELYYGAMSEMYADPVPTGWHLAAGIVLLAGVLTTDLFLRGRAPSVDGPGYKAVFFFNAYALVLAGIYAAVYLPMFPISVIMLAAFGLGIMGFSPLFCFIASLVQARALFRLRGEAPGRWAQAPRFWAAGALVVVTMGTVYAGPRIVAANVLPMTLSEDAAERERGIQLIRTFHLERQLLLSCYAPIVRGIGPTRGWAEVDIDRRKAYRDVYFRVTGVPYNAVPRPDTRATFRTRPFADQFEDERLADSEVGGATVAGRVQGLSLGASSMDVTLTPVVESAGAPCIAYIEWTVEFVNASGRQREARTQIDLPHGGVASRLTLWIDGEEREAAFGGREQVRAAYQSVAVVQRRDPALLNVCGPDKVLLQCFPVQPYSKMKLKVGVTAPLVVRDGKAYLRLPYFSERNFTVAPEFSHTVWVECAGGIEASTSSLTAEQAQPGRISLRGAILDRDLSRSAAGTIEVAGAPAPGRTFGGMLGDQTATMRYDARPGAWPGQSICFVLDGSASMRDAAIPWDTLIQALPGDANVCAVFAGSSVETFAAKPAPPSAELGAWLMTREYVGGCDQVPALAQACNMVGSGGVVVWVHGPMPVDLSSVESLRQWERLRSGAGVRILSVEAVPGPDRVLEQCGDLEMIERVPVIGSLVGTITYCVRQRAQESVFPVFTLGPAEGVAEPAEGPTSGHIVRLAVNDAVQRAVHGHRAREIDAVRALAVAARLVTPATGAVVLESKRQYDQHGLDPTKNEEAIPGVPEPHEWALLIVVCIVLLAVAARRRRALGSA